MKRSLLSLSIGAALAGLNVADEDDLPLPMPYVLLPLPAWDPVWGSVPAELRSGVYWLFWGNEKYLGG